MKKYNIPNYIRYKNDLLVQLKKIEDIDVQYLNQEQLQWKFMLLVENIARKFLPFHNLLKRKINHRLNYLRNI